MAFIDIVRPQAAEGELKAIYADIQERRGGIAEVHQLASLHPPLMQTHLDLYMAIMFGKGGLHRRERELVATAVSRANDCRYCTMHHAEAWRRYEKDEEKVQALIKDPETAPLDERERALVSYALKLTRTPSAVTQADVDAVLAQDYTQQDVLGVASVTAYFNFVNRLVLGLGAELEEDGGKGYDY